MSINVIAAKPVDLAPTGYGGIPVSFARTADTTAYTANDVVGEATTISAALEFKGMAPTGGGRIMITSHSLEIDATAVISGQTSYRLYLYSSPPPSRLADNAAFDLAAADRPLFLGYVDLGSPVDIGSTLYVQTDGVNRQIKTTGSSVWGYLVTIGAHTPASATVHVVTLHSIR